MTRSLALVTLVVVLACSTKRSTVVDLMDQLPVVDDVRAVVATESPSQVVVLRPGTGPLFLSEPRSVDQLSRLDLSTATTARPSGLAGPTSVSQPARPVDDALVLPTRAELPARVVAVELVPVADHPRTSALLIASRRASALALVEIVRTTDSSIVVQHRGVPRLLVGEMRVPSTREPDGPWIEVRIDADGADLEVVPSKPLRVRRDVAAIARAVGDLMRSQRNAAAVDVLVAPDIEAAELVGVLAALRAASPQVAIGVGAFPDERQQSVRGRAIPRLRVAQLGGDQTALRAEIVKSGRSLWACYAADGERIEARTLTLRWIAGSLTIVSGDAPASRCMRDILATVTAPPLELTIAMQPNMWP